MPNRRSSASGADPPRKSRRTIALIGNPNTGKSTLFGGLVGVRQRTGNFPGVTVEKTVGRLHLPDKTDCELIDLPGVYSLAPRSTDEAVAVRTLLGGDPELPQIDAVICVVDASHLHRNLYLVSQLLELDTPVVVALNMIDLARREGVQIDPAKLERRLNAPVVAVQASRGEGLDQLVERLGETLETADAKRTGRSVKKVPERLQSLPLLSGGSHHAPNRKSKSKQDESKTPENATHKHIQMPDVFEQEAERILDALRADKVGTSLRISERRLNFIVRRLILDPNTRFRGLVLKAILPRRSADPSIGFFLEKKFVAARNAVREQEYRIPGLETDARYAWIEGVEAECVRRPSTERRSKSDKIDALLTHRIWGLALFLLLLVLVFQAVFSWSAPLTSGIEWCLERLGGAIHAGLASQGWDGGALEGLLLDGLIGGVGGVLGFLPQILMLFFFIGILEDCGYLARAAFLTDRIMSRVGLCGKAFVPLLSCYACAVPGIMATRVIENPRHRLATIFVAPLMTCSARLPVYTMLIGAFIPATIGLKIGGVSVLGLQAGVLVSMYVVGVVAAIGTAYVLKRSLLKGEHSCFVLELPNYKFPSPRTVLFRVAERGWAFVRGAGTIICVASIIVWALLYFPHDSTVVEQDPHVIELKADRILLENESVDDEIAIELARLEARLSEAEATAYQRTSYLGSAGRAIEPLFAPMGWDWRIGCSVLASFPAREIVVASLGVSFHASPESYEQDALPAEEGEDMDVSQFQARLQAATWDGTDRPLFNIPVALSLMVFFTLCAQCSATLAAMRRETNSWRWPIAAFVYMTVLAYVSAAVVYRVGMLFA